MAMQLHQTQSEDKPRKQLDDATLTVHDDDDDGDRHHDTEDGDGVAEYAMAEDGHLPGLAEPNVPDDEEQGKTIQLWDSVGGFSWGMLFQL